MKLTFVILLLLSSVTHAQVATIKKIKLISSTPTLDATDSSMVYPIIVLQNHVIAKQINNQVKEVMTGSSDEKESIKNAFSELIENDGLSEMSYTITFNKNGILSFYIYTEASIGRIIGNTYYFNFDLRNGKKIEIVDLIDSNQMKRFTKKIFTIKIFDLERYKKGELLDHLHSGDIDSTSYNEILEQVNYCENSVSMNDFSLSKKSVEIIDPCELGNALRAVGPDYELKYAYPSIYSFLKPGYRVRIFN